MEHIVQFAINIDDDRIRSIIEQGAEKQIVKDLQQQVLNKLLTPSGYYRSINATPDDPLSPFTEGVVKSVFEQHEDKIIEKAAELLADRLARTKRGKAILERMEETT